MSRIIRALVLVVALAGAPGAAGAQPVVTDHVTPGGLAFRYSRMPANEPQTIEFGWKDASALAPAGKPGIISLAPRMVLQGPNGMTRGEFIEDAKDLEARWHLGGSTHFVTGGLAAPPEKFPAAVDLFARTLADPALRPAHLVEIKKRIAAGIRAGASGAGTMSSQIGAHLVIPDGGFRDWMLGERAVYDAVELADIEQWRRAVLVRQGVSIASAGPMAAEEVAPLIDKLFAALPERGSHVPAASPDLMTPPARVIVREADVPQTYISVGSWTGYRNDGELVRGRLLTRILQKRLFDVIRGRLGAAYGANAGLGSIVPDRYSISLSSAVAHESAAAALAALDEVYAKFLADGVSEDEVAPMRLRLRSEAIGAQIRAGAMAGALLSAMLNDLGADHVQRSLERIDQLSAAAINTDIRTKLAGRPLTTIVVAPSAAPFKADCVIKAAAEVHSACR